MKNKTLSAVALATLSLTLAACNNKQAGGAASTLVIQQSADIPTLDPGTTYDTSSGQVVENMYETLVGYQGNNITEVVPVLATEWQASNGDREYRFTLREGVKFHSGNDFTCADAEYTFRRNLVTNTADSGNWFLSESLLGTPSNANDDKSVTWAKISSAVKCDGKTLVFTLPAVDPAFLTKLAYIGQGIVDSKHAKEIGEWDGTEATWKDAVGKDLMGSALSKQPSGTGAYKLQGSDANATTLTAFDGYWGEDKPKITNVILQKVPEQAARIQAFLKGDADFIEEGGRPIISAQLTGKPGVSVIDDLPNTTASGFSMNQQIAAGSGAIGSGKLDGQGIPADFFKDADVRRGFVASFDVPTYIDQVQEGKGAPRNFLLPDSFPGYDSNLEAAQFDPELAKAAFQRAWGGQVWDKGFTVSISYRAGSQTQQTAMELLKKNVEALNPKFRVNIVAKEWSELIDSKNVPKEAMVLGGWAPDYADADNFVSTFYASNGYYGPRLNANDAQMDTWIKEARSTTDVARRDELYAQIAKRALDEAYYIVMPASPTVFTYRDNIQGISDATFNPMIAFTSGTYWKNLSKE
ncbi:ABC transporter substrate-binding protein [Deinococcus sp. JMULE3]|uniref:ABC transporter substrate-binding protein n=1 Tax=Deinococcus sp. JMULE3 TaxID=2518341 RepID=UPI00157531E9|nr:ABC transporter substrate-binding protein [Deinococcus sp. JMULE3]NTY01642.1 ABC transporter substrate-binding protein [Deinococcus sp. JMULE3]